MAPVSGRVESAVSSFRDAVTATARHRHLEVVRFDIDRKGALSALARSSVGQLEGFVPGPGGVVSFGPTDDPRLFRASAWIDLDKRSWGGDDMSVVAYRPLKRLVVEVTSDGSPTRYVKVHRQRLSDERAQFVARTAAFPRLLARQGVDGIAAEVWAAAPGAAVRDRLAAGDRERWVDDVARLLASIARSGGDRLPVLTTGALVGQSATSLDRARRLGVVPPIEASDLLDDVVRELSRVPVPLTVAHGDLHDAQIVVGPDGAVALDPDSLCRAPEGWDVATLAAHIDLAGIRHGDDLTDVRRNLVAAWRRARGADAEPALPALDAFRRLVLIRLAGVYARRPGRSSWVRPLVDAASRRDETTCAGGGA